MLYVVLPDLPQDNWAGVQAGVILGLLAYFYPRLLSIQPKDTVLDAVTDTTKPGERQNTKAEEKQQPVSPEKAPKEPASERSESAGERREPTSHPLIKPSDDSRLAPAQHLRAKTPIREKPITQNNDQETTQREISNPGEESSTVSYRLRRKK
jgi:hypothetical protein